jgi:hypothetical protein
MRLKRVHRHRTLNCEQLEDRRLLAGNLAVDGEVSCTAPTVDAVIAAEVDDPPETRTRTRTEGDKGDGVQKRPGRGW